MLLIDLPEDGASSSKGGQWYTVSAVKGRFGAGEEWIARRHARTDAGKGD